MRERLRQAAHRVTGALIEGTQRRNRSLVRIRKDRAYSHEQIRCVLEQRMAHFLFDVESLVACFTVLGAFFLPRSLVLR
jgi:hypothetical protein